MSQQQGQSGGWLPPSAGGTPPPPTAPYGMPPTQGPPPPPGGPYQPAARKGGKGKIIAAAAAAVVVVAGGAFAAVQLSDSGSASGGADTPDAAVDQMLASLEENDIVGMIDALAPGEREVTQDSLNDYVDELKRLGVLSDDANLEDVPGFLVDFQAMEYQVEDRNDRVSMVEITGGEVTFSSQLAELPLGDVILDQVGGDMPEDAPEQTVDIADAMAESGGDALRIGVINEDDRWYVSSFYTVAELAAESGGYEMPAAPIPAVGADSPEEAVVEMAQAIGGTDVNRMIELTPPDEMAALHDYGQILVDMADDEVSDALGTEGLQVDIEEYEFDTTDVTGGTKVVPTRLVATLAAEGEEVRIEATKQEGSCLEYSVTGADVDESDTVCADDIRPLLEDQGDLPPELVDLAVRELGQLSEIGVVTVEVDGAWYVSPLRTYNDLFLVAMQGMEDGDLEALLDFAQNS